MQSREPDLALSYASNDLSTFVPVEDDQNLVNDVTVSRPGGSSYRYSVTTGNLSIQEPPAGVGRYDTSTELSVGTTPSSTTRHPGSPIRARSTSPVTRTSD